MGSTTAAGTQIAMSAGIPAAQTDTAYAALTYTVIGNVEQLGAIGATFAKVEFQPLSGDKEKHKGSRDNGALQPSMAHDDIDAGQTLFRTANESNANYAFRVTYPNGAIRYFQGRVFGYPENVGNADSVITANPTVEINTRIVKVAPTP